MMNLKYLFLVEYEDGSTFAQPYDDHSELEPEKRSAFYDVLNSNKKIKAFSISDKKGKTYSVNLQTGEFKVAGEIIRITPEQNLTKLKPEYRLIYFREHQHDLNAETMKEIDHRVSYYIGWQCTVGGKNYQQLLSVN